jgi:chemotaxis signal transduction protein
MSLANLFQDNSRVLTFTIANSHFGIDVSNILSFSDEFDHIQPVNSTDRPGFIGYLDYRDTLVNVYDSATVLKRKRNRDEQNKLINDIEQYKQAHIDWVATLENSITSGQAFTLARDPKMCAFGKWYYSFSTSDEDLMVLMKRLEEPHILIHNMADKLLDMRDNNEGERALRLLSIEKATTLKKLLRILDLVQDMLKRNIHPVVLHLTKDGNIPWFSLVLDEVDDIIDYEIKQLDTSASEALSHEPVTGYLRHRSGKRYMMLSIEKLYKQVSKIQSIEDCNS